MNHAAAYWLLALGTVVASTPARADSLGMYVGAAVGQSRVSSNFSTVPESVPVTSDHYFGAWKGFVGARPLSWLGIELAYIDFGNTSPSPTSSTIFGYFKGNLKQTAPALFGVGYLPLPVRFVELYGKLGIARLRSDASESYSPPSCPAGFTVIALFRTPCGRFNQPRILVMAQGRKHASDRLPSELSTNESVRAAGAQHCFLLEPLGISRASFSSESGRSADMVGAPSDPMKHGRFDA
jgi:hypothetical protein